MNESTRRRRIAEAALIAFVALAARFAFWSEIRGTPLDAWHRWDQTDMATYLTQAQRFLEGDWLGREPYHPYAEWQKSAGTEEDWLRWYGPRAFHQAPLYSYALAAATRATARSIDLVKLLQILLGAATCVLIAGVARAIDGDATALISGLIAALYGPLFYLEPQLLREGPAIFGFALLLRLLTHRTDGFPEATRRASLVAAIAGILLGIYATFYETGSVLAVAAAVVLAARLGRRSWRPAAWATVALACGWLVGFAPLLARNVAVGSPPLATSSRLAVNLAYANMSGAAGGGAFFVPPGPQLARIMDASGGSVPGVLREVLRGYAGDPSRLVRNLGLRFLAVWAVVELPDNTSFDFYRREASLLAVSFDFGWIFAPGAAAILLLLGSRLPRRGGRGLEGGGRPAGVFDRAWTERRAVHAAILTFVPFLLAALVAVHPQARYRLFLVPILIVYAALFLALIARCFRAREFGSLAVLAAAALLLSVAQRALSAPLRPVAERPVDYAAAAHLALQEDRPDMAIAYYRDGIAVHAREAGLRVELAQVLADSGRYPEAIEQMRVAATVRPDLPELSEAVVKLEAMQAAPVTSSPPTPSPPRR